MDWFFRFRIAWAFKKTNKQRQTETETVAAGWSMFTRQNLASRANRTGCRAKWTGCRPKWTRCRAIWTGWSGITRQNWPIRALWTTLYNLPYTANSTIEVSDFCRWATVKRPADLVQRGVGVDVLLVARDGAVRAGQATLAASSVWLNR